MEIGERLATHLGFCIVRDSAGGCQTCASTLRRGQTLANVMVAPGQLALAAGAVTRPAGRHLEAAQRVALWRRWDQHGLQVILTVLTAILIAAGWIERALGLPQEVTTGLYIAA